MKINFDDFNDANSAGAVPDSKPPVAAVQPSARILSIVRQDPVGEIERRIAQAQERERKAIADLRACDDRSREASMRGDTQAVAAAALQRRRYAQAELDARGQVVYAAGQLLSAKQTVKDDAANNRVPFYVQP